LTDPPQTVPHLVSLWGHPDQRGPSAFASAGSRTGSPSGLGQPSPDLVGVQHEVAVLSAFSVLEIGVLVISTRQDDHIRSERPLLSPRLRSRSSAAALES